MPTTRGHLYEAKARSIAQLARRIRTVRNFPKQVEVSAVQAKDLAEMWAFVVMIDNRDAAWHPCAQAKEALDFGKSMVGLGRKLTRADITHKQIVTSITIKNIDGIVSTLLDFQLFVE